MAAGTALEGARECTPGAETPARPIDLPHEHAAGDAVGRAERALVVVLLLLCLYFAARTHKAAAWAQDDFGTYYHTSLDATRGQNPYRDREAEHRSPYIYPPLLFWLMTPLTWLPVQIAAVVWVWLTLGAWWLTNRLARDGLTAHAALSSRDAALVVWLPSLLALRPLWRELGMGNVNMFTMLCVVTAFWALTRGRDALAGLAIAAAGVIKIIPLAFVLPLVMWRRWRALGACVVCLVGLMALPEVTYGPARYAEILGQFARCQLFTQARKLEMDCVASNQSLAATASRYLTTVSALPPHRPPFTMNLARLPLEVVGAVLVAVALLLIFLTGLALARCRCRPGLHGLCFALVFLTMHMVSKKTWEEHLVTLLLVYAALLAGPASWRREGWVAMATAVSLQWLSVPVLGRDLSDRIQALGPTTASMVVLWGHIYGRLMRSRGETFG